MCGRARLAVPPEDLAEAFDAVLPAPIDASANLNIAPTDSVLVLRMNKTGEREIVPMRWGLVPFYEQDFDHAKPLINARVESAATRPAFREAFKHKRCLVLADGFYEWKHEHPAGSKKVRKRPYVLQRPRQAPFAMAGLWQRWHGKDGRVRESCTVITRDATPPVDALHDRMPVILEGADIAAWLDPAADPVGAQHVLDHAVTEGWVATPLDRVPDPPARRQLGLFG
jgi:putative SOS response-associated peptidase YedK